MYLARMIFTCETPLHCGGGTDQFFDQPVCRDSAGFYLIPGTSVAGALRAVAKKIDSANTDLLFGSANGKDEEQASKIWCSDAHLLDFDSQLAITKTIAGKNVEISNISGPYIRDHVKITNEGVAAEGGKYDEEIIPPGCKFAIELVLDGWNKPIISECKDLFFKLCSALKDKEVTFGGKTTNGYGKICFDDFFEIREFDLTTPEGMKAYLNLSKGPKFNPNEGVKIDEKVLNQYATSTNSDTFSGNLCLKLCPTGPIMVVGTNENNSDADLTCMQVPIVNYSSKKLNFTPVIPGSSIKGVLRHRMQQIALAKGMEESCIDSIFGAIDGEFSGVGKLNVEDMQFKNSSKEIHIQHVAIDRFTGGALTGALFDECPILDENTELYLKITLNGLTLKEMSVLTFALLDLTQESLPIGNGTNRGNGRLALKKTPSYLENVSCKISRNGSLLEITNGKGNLDLASSWIDEMDKESF